MGSCCRPRSEFVSGEAVPLEPTEMKKKSKTSDVASSPKTSDEKSKKAGTKEKKSTKRNLDPNLPAICLFFEAHQPNRLKPYSFFQIGSDPFYENDTLNQQILSKVSERCYLPANALFERLTEETKGDFRFSMSLSGVFLEQCEHHRPDVLKSFQDLHAAGGLELLAETYYHSMGYHQSKGEFEEQVALQQQKLKEVFDCKPSIYRHTEQIYFNELAAHMEDLGFKGMLAEGVERVLQGRSANRLYQAPNVKRLKTLLRAGGLSDDLGFRFGDHDWAEHPLMAGKFADWCQASGGDVVNLQLNYETIGEHQGKETGIFEFWEAFVKEWIERGGEFLTPSEVIARFEAKQIYDCHEPTSWADTEKDLSPWKGNTMQLEARRKILLIEKAVKAKDDPELLHQWRKMHTSDHIYYMSTKERESRAVHESFRPYSNAYDPYLYFMNALSDLQLRVEE